MRLNISFSFVFFSFFFYFSGHTHMRTLRVLFSDKLPMYMYTKKFIMNTHTRVLGWHVQVGRLLGTSRVRVPTWHCTVWDRNWYLLHYHNWPAGVSINWIAILKHYFVSSMKHPQFYLYLTHAHTLLSFW